MNKRELVCYNTDASRMIGKAENVYFPKSKEEVSSIVRNSALDIVPRGAGTNFMGGTIPNNSIVIDLGKMNKVTEFNPIKKTVHVEAGITINELNEKLNSVGFEFPIYNSYKLFSTIGGLIALNLSGERSMKYGNVRDWIEEIEFVNGKGEISKTSKADMMDICSMEGITGVITEATIKIIPLIKRTASIFQSDNIEEIFDMFRKLKSEKEVVMLMLIPPSVSEWLGFKKKYNLIIEFDTNRGKIYGEEYLKLKKDLKLIIKSIFAKYYIVNEDIKVFSDKLKEIIIFLESSNVIYFSQLGTGTIYLFFKDSEKVKKESVMNFLKKIGIKNGSYGIGLLRKELVDSFDKKVIQRIKLRLDPYLKLNNEKLISVEYSPKQSELTKNILANEEKNSYKIQEIKSQIKKEIIVQKEIQKIPENNQREVNKIKENQKEQKEIDYNEMQNNRKKDIETIKKEISKNFQNEITKKTSENEIIPSGIINSNEKNLKEINEEIKKKQEDYMYTFKTNPQKEEIKDIEKIAKNISKDKTSGNILIDNNFIKNIMVNNLKSQSKENKEKTEELKKTGEESTRGKMTKEEQDLINKILGNKYDKK